MVIALAGRLDQFRPTKAAGYDGAVTWSKATLSGVKLGQPSKGWSLDTAGAVRMNTATLYWNVGHSGQKPALVPPFQPGDVICSPSQGTSPGTERLTVQAVTEQTFKGVLHHYEVVLV